MNNVTFRYQWLSSDGTHHEEIAGATNATYELVEEDEGKAISVRVSFNDDAGNRETLTSISTVPVAARPNRKATGTLIVQGTPQVGETLTVDTSSIDDLDGMSEAVLAYTWKAGRRFILGHRCHR